MKRILCGIDGSDHADVALRAAVDLAENLGAELSFVLVNVPFDTSPRGPQALLWVDDVAQAILDAATEVASRRGQKVSDAAIVPAREVCAGIIDYAVEHDIDTIVMGTGGKRGLWSSPSLSRNSLSPTCQRFKPCRAQGPSR